MFWSRRELDLLDTGRIRDAVLKQRPDCVINAAAYTSVDRAESAPETAYAVNAMAVAELARATSVLGAPLIHLSTDYVFDGGSERPYREDDAVAPLNVYGRTKLGGELAAQTLCERHWIFRTSWVFSEHGGNFVKTMLRLADAQQQVNVVNDQRGRPTYAGDIADTIVDVLSRLRQGDTLPWGVYHLACQDECSWYDFARAVYTRAQQTGLLEKPPELVPIATRDYPSAAARPTRSTLDTSRLESFLGRPLPAWRAGLERVLHALQQAKGSATPAAESML
jgi:dTDP-4-dehydrorhamnose reductase